MDVVDIARWQFGIITVYHFLFVPLTIGLAAAGRRDARPPGCAPATRAYLRLTKFFGKLFLINFAIGVVTGIVQEFQFGMNWSRLLALRRRRLRRAAGDRGAARVLPRVDVPRAVDLRLGQAARAGCTWPASGSSRVGTLLSAYFILAANSWMQHPVGYALNPDTGRAELDRLLGGADQQGPAGDLPARRSLAAYLTGGAFVVGVSRLAATSRSDARRSDRDDVPHGRSGSAPGSRWSPGSASPSPATSRARS